MRNRTPDLRVPCFDAITTPITILVVLLKYIASKIMTSFNEQRGQQAMVSGQQDELLISIP